MVAKLDMTDHAPAVATRKQREKTDAIVIHHIDVGTSFADVVKFFTEDPEGVATVVLSGSYESKLPTIKKWRAEGVPKDVKRLAFVPYHFLVDAEGKVARMLNVESRGAHAGTWNSRSVAVCCLGTFADEAPSDAQYATCLAVVKDILDVYQQCKVFDHDETLVAGGGKAKGCVGKAFPLQKLRDECA